MPYQNEFAQYNSVRRMSGNLRVKQLLRQYCLSGPETPHEADSGLYRLVNNNHGKMAAEEAIDAKEENTNTALNDEAAGEGRKVGNVVPALNCRS